MTALFRLGVQLARAGGKLRICSIIVGNLIGAIQIALSTSVLLAALMDLTTDRRTVIDLAIFTSPLLISANVLLMAVGRLSSAVRDRRLAALRLIGLTPNRTRIVAGVENATLAFIGGSLGLLLLVALIPLLNLRQVGGFQPLLGTTSFAPWQLLTSLLFVVVLSIAVGIAPTWTNSDLRTVRSETTEFRPQWWRAALLVISLITYAFLLLRPIDSATQERWLLVYSGATTLGILGLALVTPSFTRKLAIWINQHSGSISARLGAKALEMDAASSSRVVSGLTVAVGMSSLVLAYLTYANYNVNYTFNSQLAASEFDQTVRIRFLFYAASGDLVIVDYGFGLMLIVALISVALTSIDRIIERRRIVARQVMIGVPPAILTKGQLLQVTAPALVSATSAVIFVSLSTRVWDHIFGVSATFTMSTALTVIVVAAVGVALIALAAIPLTRIRLTPELLRRE